MSVYFGRLGLVLCFVALASACVDSGNEPRTAAAATAQPDAASARAASDCRAIARFSRISFIAADLNGDGVIDEAEFASDIAAAFAGEDKDLDRCLTRAELPDAPSGAFERINPHDGSSFTFRELMAAKLVEFDRADANRDGVLSIGEVSRFNARQDGC